MSGSSALMEADWKNSHWHFFHFIPADKSWAEFCLPLNCLNCNETCARSCDKNWASTEPVTLATCGRGGRGPFIPAMFSWLSLYLLQKKAGEGGTLKAKPAGAWLHGLPPSAGSIPLTQLRPYRAPEERSLSHPQPLHVRAHPPEMTVQFRDWGHFHCIYCHWQSGKNKREPIFNSQGHRHVYIYMWWADRYIANVENGWSQIQPSCSQYKVQSLCEEGNMGLSLMRGIAV